MTQTETTTTNSTIRPGQVWLDTNGERIQAHGGSVHYEDGVFYWYGENKENAVIGSDVWHQGVRCYSSTDLYNWEDRGLIIPPVEDDPTSPLHPSRQMDRPHIIFNATTKKYVCWIKVMGAPPTQLSTVLTSDSILGPYTVVASDFRPLGMNAGDFDLAIHPSDGKAYYYFERVHSEMICADLTADYTDVTGYYSTHFPKTQPPWVREAPAYFERAGVHYLATSGTTGYFPNPSEIASAHSFHGPWTELGDLHPHDETRTSYRSQISSIFKHPHKKDLYIAIADRWLPGIAAEDSNREEFFTRIFGGEDEATVRADIEVGDDGLDISIADYVWLPIRFDGDRPRIDWTDEWRVEDFD